MTNNKDIFDVFVDKTSTEQDNGFPWNSVGKRSSVGMGWANKVVGMNVHVGMAYTGIAVARNLHVGMGQVSEAIVFDKVDVGMGSIKELHCLSSTRQNVGCSGVGKIVFHSMEELVQMAYEKLEMSPEQLYPSASAPPSESVQVNAYVIK